MDMAWDSAAYEWRASSVWRERPFRFEDLAGRDEPESWGPIYPKTASARVEKFRAIGRGRELEAGEAREYAEAIGVWIRGLNAPKRAPCTLSTRTNAPSGQPGEFDAAKHRAKIRAESAAASNRARLEWALGRSKDSQGRSIADAYKDAMRAKREREAASLEWREAA